MYYLNEQIKNLNRVFDQNDRGGYLRLDLNENPGSLPKKFLQDVWKGITPDLLSQYPETCFFTEILAKHLGADPSQLCLVNGSAEGIRYLIEAFTSENGRIVGVVPSYFMFQVYSKMYNRCFIKVPYEDDLTMDVSKICRELTWETQMLILLNPNNPMGNVYSKEEWKAIWDICKERQITVLIDEAYAYFNSNTFLNVALTERRVFVTRTFSKFFSLAGCRLGYVVGHPDDIEIVQKLCTPHNTNIFALKFAGGLLENTEVMDAMYAAFWEGRRFLIRALEENEYQWKGEAGNFLFIQPKSDAQRVVERMKSEKKILIKSYSGVGMLGNCLRVTIGEKKFMEQFVEALLELDR